MITRNVTNFIADNGKCNLVKSKIISGLNNGLEFPSTKGEIAVIVNNGRSYPTVIDSTGDVITSPPNTSFTIAGNEQYVNSGFLVPSTAGKAFPGSSNTFTATFQKAGTYYLSLLHP